MIRPLLTAVLALGSCAAILTAVALAAYGSPRLEATQSGNRVTIDVAQSAGDDPTAMVRIISPLSTAIADAQPVGTAIGEASATFVATAAGGAPLTSDGPLEVLVAGPIAQSELTGCAEGERVEGLWSLRLAGAVSVNVPVYLLVGGDLLLCLPHPSTLAQGAKLVGLTLTLEGPLRLRPAGTWISIWVPYGATEAPDLSRAVASPAVVGAGAVTFTARAKGNGAVLVGFVRQAGALRADARVRITGGPRPSRQRVLGTATTNRGGQFTFRAKSGTYFRATASVGRSSPPGICFVLEPFLRPIPCVNPTLNGFSVQSATVRKR